MKKKKITTVFVIVVFMAVILCGCKSNNIVANNNASNKENTNIKKALIGKKWVGKRMHIEIEFMNGDYLEVENIYNNKEKTLKTRTKEDKNEEFCEFHEPVPYNMRVEEFDDNNRMTTKIYDTEVENNVLAINVYQYDIMDNNRIYIKLLPIESTGDYLYDVDLHGVEATINVSKDEFTTITTLDSKFYEEMGHPNTDRIEKIIVTATRVIQE